MVSLPRITTATALAGLVLSSCASPQVAPRTAAVPNPTLNAEAATPLDRYRAVAQAVEGELNLAPHPGGRLSETQKLAVTEEIRQWQDGDGRIQVDIPANQPADGDSVRMAQSVAAFLISLGASADRISLGRYDSKSVAGPVRIRYHGTEAIGPDCRKGWDNFSATGANKTTEHFGCAVAANLAAMVANPRDLMRPAPETAADASRRGVIFAKYRKGEPTSAAKDEQASGNVSQAVK